MSKKSNVGVIHGRFQILHNGHIEYLMAGIERCHHLIIGIANYDTIEPREMNNKYFERLKLTSNPFTYLERLQMVKDGMIEQNVELCRFDIVPFPIEEPSKLMLFTPNDATFYITIYDSWGEEKLKRLHSLGLKTEIMWRKPLEEKITSGTEIRQKISNGESWIDFVPRSTYDYIIKNNLDKRIIRQSRQCDENIELQM